MSFIGDHTHHHDKLQNTTTRSVCSTIRIADTVYTIVCVENQLRISNRNLVIVFNKFSHLNFAQLRGHIFETLHVGTFNINSTIVRSNIIAIQTSSIPKFSTYVADVAFITRSKMGNIREAIRCLPKNMTAQLKSGVTSARTIMSPKYSGMMKVSEVACKNANTTLKLGTLTSDVISTSKLTKVTSALIAGKKVSTMNRLTILGKIGKSTLCKGLFWVSVGESVVRNGYHVYNGDQTMLNAGKEVVLDVFLVNDGIKLYKWYKGSNIQTSGKKLATVDNKKSPIKIKISPSSQNAKSITTSSNEISQQKQNIALQTGAVLLQQCVATALISITDKLVRGQPLNFEDHVLATCSGLSVCGGSIGGAYIGNYLTQSNVNPTGTSNGSLIGAGIGAGVISIVVDLGMILYKDGTLLNLTKKDACIIGAKGIVTTGFSIGAEKILGSLDSISSVFGAGCGLGALTSFGFALYAKYETRTFADYNMNKWTWLSVGSAVCKSAISSGVGLAVSAVIVATNWWNPIGWVAGIVTAVLVHSALTYGEEKCSDSWGQRKKHMDHCCQILGCSDNITRKEFNAVIRRNRSKFHPDKTKEDNQEQLLCIQECIDAYYILRKWDAEELFKNEETMKTSKARKLFNGFYDAVINRLRAIAILKMFNEVKTYNCYVNNIVLFDKDEEIPEYAHPIVGGETLDSKQLRVIYSEDKYKEYAITSFSIMHNKKQIQSVSTMKVTTQSPIRSVLIVNYKPQNNIMSAEISTGLWLIGLTDESQQILNNIAEDHDKSMEDID